MFIIFHQKKKKKKKKRICISCKLSPMETICMECQNLFSGKNNKNIANFSSADLAQWVVKVKQKQCSNSTWICPSDSSNNCVHRTSFRRRYSVIIWHRTDIVTTLLGRCLLGMRRSACAVALFDLVCYLYVPQCILQYPANTAQISWMHRLTLTCAVLDWY